MKILFIHNRYQQRGGEDVAVELETQLLREKGHAVELLTFSNDALQKGALGKLRAGLHAIYNPGSAAAVKEAILRFHPDVIHVHNLFFTASPAVLWPAARYKVPVVCTLHNFRLICANALLLRDNHICERCTQKTFPLSGIRYKCYRNSAAESGLVTMVTGVHKVMHTWRNKVSAYIVLTEFARKKLQQSSLGATDRQLKIKPNFIFPPAEDHLPREDRFLFVGRLAPEKGVDVLLEAFSGLPSNSLLIVGDGPLKTTLQEKYRHCDNISFAGNMDKEDVLRCMASSRALIFPSIWYEGLPFTIVEAFATGTPVIASDLGSMTELISDGHNGYLFPAGDVQSLRQKIDSFNEHPPQWQTLCDNAKNTYINKYHPDIHYSAVMDIYQDAIQRK